MTRRQVRVAHCFRCIYTWRMRNRLPRMCPRCKSRLWNVPRIREASQGEGQGVEEILTPHRGEILRLAHRFGATNIRVFGSVRRGDADEKSDVDLLVGWRAGVSLLDSAGFRIALTDLLKRKVDVVDERYLHWAIRPQVIAEALPL